jgi:hypothetical protein
MLHRARAGIVHTVEAEGHHRGQMANALGRPIRVSGRWQVFRTLPFGTLEDKYQLLDEGTLEIQETQGGARKRIRFAFRTADEVTFTYPDGPPVVLSRVK